MLGLRSSFAVLVFLQLLLTPELVYCDDQPGFSKTAKSYIDKPSGSSSVRLLEGLIHRVDKIETNLKKLDSIDEKLDKLINHQNDLMKAWGDTLNDCLSYNSWKEYEGCGGVVNTESGDIIGKFIDDESSYYSAYRSQDGEECLWIINANHRHWIRISLLGRHSRRSTIDGAMTNCKAYQFHFDFKPRNAATFKLHSVVSLKEDRTYLILGPVMLLSCVCTSNQGNQKLEFEGVGPQLYQNAYFRAVYADKLSGTLDVAAELDQIKGELRNKENVFLFLIIHSVYHRLEYYERYYRTRTLISSKRKTPNRLEVMIPNSEFCDSDAMSLTLNARSLNSTILDCCATNCFGKRFTLLNETAIAMININISATQERTSPALSQLRWATIDYPMDTSTCGYISRGKLSGEIDYDESFNDHLLVQNQRCVWLVVPYPSNHTEIVVTKADVEEGHEDLFVAEIWDNGTITKFSIREPNTYFVYSKAFLILLHLDATFSFTGVSLSWKSFPYGNIGISMFSRDYDESFVLAADSGSAILALNASDISSRLSVVVITQEASIHDAHYSRNLSLSYGISGFGEMFVYQSTNASLSLADKISTDVEHQTRFDSREYISQDGVFVIVSKVESNNGSVAAEFEWDQGLMTTPTVETGCRAMISSKWGRVAVESLPLSGCRWIISGNCETIEFQLMKNRTQSSLLIQTINPLTGKIDHPPITWTESHIKVMGNLMILTVKTSNPGKKESVDFMFTGEGESVGRIFSHIVLGGGTKYPIGNMSLTSNDLVVYLNDQLDSSGSWTEFNVFGGAKYHAGQAYNMTWYKLSKVNSSAIKVLDCTIVTGSLQEECTFLEPVASTDFHSHNESFRAYMNQSLLVTVKPLGNVSEHDFGFQLNFADSDYASCGGLYNSETGSIVYKENESLDSTQCFWVIGNAEVPATSITFDVITYGLSTNDVIKFISINLHTADIEDAASVRINSTSTQVVIHSPVVLMHMHIKYNRYDTRHGFRINYSMNMSEIEGRYNMALLYKTKTPTRLTIPTKRQKELVSTNTTVIACLQLQTHRWRSNVFEIEKLILGADENCNVDVLRFFNLHEVRFDLTKAYSAVKNFSCEETTTQSSPYYYDPVETTHPEILAEDNYNYQEDQNVGTHNKSTHTSCDPKCFSSNIKVPTSFMTSGAVLLIYKTTAAVTEERILIKWKTDYDY